MYPFDGVIALRVPHWSSQTIVRINGEVIETSDICVNGYVKIDRMWQDNDRIEIFFDMSVKQVRANSVVTQNAGRFAIQRGPIIYCIESIDNGENLEDIFVEKDTKFYVDGEIDAAGVKAVVFDAKRRVCDDDQLYSFTEIKAVHFKAVAVPYFYRSNRGESEMLVWIRENL